MAAMYHPLIEQIKRKYYQCMDLEGVNVWNDLILLYQGSTVYPQMESKNGYLDGRTIKSQNQQASSITWKVKKIFFQKLLVYY